MAVNDDILEKVVSHQIGVNRLTSGMIGQVQGLLNARDSDLVQAIFDRAKDDNTISMARVDAILKDINRLNTATFKEIRTNLRGSLTDLATYEADYQVSAIGGILPMDWVWEAPSKRELSSFLKDELIYGATLDEWVQGMQDGRFQRIRNAVRIGAVSGENVNDIVRRLTGTKRANYRDGVLDVSRRSAASVTRVLTSGVTTGVRSDLYAANDDLMDQVQWVSVLDGRTTLYCLEQDSKIYPVDEGPRPPAHFGCRSIVIPVIKSADDIGLDPDDLTAEQWDSLNGEPAEKLTFAQWFKRQSPEFQDDLLGIERGKLYRLGKLKVDRFRDYSGKVYSLPMLRQLEKPKKIVMAKRPTVRRNFGWHPDIPDRRDLQFGVEYPGDIGLPQLVSLRRKMPPVFDQGNLGTCVPNAVIAAAMFALGPKTPMLSRLDLYYDTRVIEGTIKSDAGSEIRDAIKVMAKQGVISEEEWPYRPRKYRLKPPTVDTDEYKIKKYTRLTSHQDFMRCLASGYPFVGGFTVYENFEEDTVERTGILTMPTIDEKPIGAHAVDIIGYDQNFHKNPVFKRSGLSENEVPAFMYECRNSFGVDWGDDGHFFIPAAYIENKDLADDFWTIRTGGLVAAFNPYHDPETGRFDFGPGGGAEFVSPNVGQLDFPGARQALSSSRQKVMRSACADVDAELGIKARDSDIIGAWSDGAENSIMSIEENSDWNRMQLSAAMKGHLGDQKSVLIFQSEKNGPSTLYKFEAKGDLDDIHKNLLVDGVAFHTLVPNEGGATVYVVDLDSSAIDAVDRGAARYDAKVQYETGRAEFIGTQKEDGTDREQRDDARATYEKVISQSKVSGGDKAWTRLRDRWGQALDAMRVISNPSG